MYFHPSWVKKIGLFCLLGLLYLLLPEYAQKLVGCFAVGWMFVDISEKVFN